MMPDSKLTPFEHIFPSPNSAAYLVNVWNQALVDNMLDIVWRAYDAILPDLGSINWDDDIGDVERSITELLERAMQREMRESGGFMPVQVRHGAYERELRKPDPAQPPEYDIAFEFNENPRLKWPLEAKVLKSDANTASNLKDYVDAIEDRFLMCRYAPFSDGGAMLGYLQGGDPQAVASNISVRLGCLLTAFNLQPNRCHKYSDHQRQVPTDKPYPQAFRCHHMIMPL